MAAEMDALSLLKRDHELVKDLMKRIEKEERDTKARAAMFEQLVDELGIHERIEEEIFYPALKEKKDAKEDVLEGFEEHHLVDEIIEDLDDVKPDDERWAAKFTVMKENVEHHIEDEEEKLFPKAEKLLGGKKLGELGVKMADLKEAEKQALAEQLEEDEAEQGTSR
jgi:hemerythrin superfamily protein